MKKKDVLLSDKAIGKQKPLLPTDELETVVKNMDGDLYHNSGTGTHFLKHIPKEKDRNKPVLILMKIYKKGILVTLQTTNHKITDSNAIKPVEEAV